MGRRHPVEFASPAVRALVRLHEEEMQKLLDAWRDAKAAGVVLPASSDPDYESLEKLIVHPLRSARGYVTWICEKLDLPAPRIPDPPEAGRVDEEGERYLDALFQGWEDSLAGLTDAVLDANEAYMTRWQAPMTIEGMLEHAIVHPMRHRTQLIRLLWEQRDEEEEDDIL